MFVVDLLLKNLGNTVQHIWRHFWSSIITFQGDLEKAISFYRSALALEPNFEPARNRLQAILCTLLFDENGALRESMDGLPDN